MRTAEVDRDELERLLPAFDAAANALLDYLGPPFTGTEDGHLETDIAAAAATAGSSLLRCAVPDLSVLTPGTAILADVHRGQQQLFRFMAAAGPGLGLSETPPQNHGDEPRHQPLLPLEEMVGRLQEPLRAATADAGLPLALSGYVGALAAMKLIAAGKSLELLDERVGKSIAMHYVVAGSKTVPPALSGPG